MKKLILILLLWAGWTPFLLAEYISDYHVRMDILQSGNLHITETITYHFQNAQRHGIYRDIPFTVKGSGRPRDIGIKDFSVMMDGGQVPWEKSTLYDSDSGNMKRLKIGSPSSTVTGSHTYTIGYTVTMGVLPSSLSREQDAVRWNMIGTGWTVPILRTRGDIYLPLSLGKDDVTVRTFVGHYGSSRSGKSPGWVDDHHFQISHEKLSDHEGLTVEISYPVGTLDQIGSENMAISFYEKLLNSWHWPVLFGFLLYLFNTLSRQSGFTDKRSIAPRYTAPDGLSVLQSGLIYDKFADNDDFSAAILELGQKGYLEIYQKKKSDNPLLEKTTQSTSDLSEDMQYLMEEVLFKNSTTHKLKMNSSKEASDLRKGFDTINEKLYEWSVQYGYMQSNPADIRKKFLIKIILSFLPVVALTILSIITLFGVDQLILLIFPAVFISVGLTIALKNRGVFQKVFGFVFAAFGTIPLFIILESGISFGMLLTSPLLALIVIPLAIFYVYKRIGPYTTKGAYTHKHLLGLKEFMSRVKEDELRRRLKEDPLYLEKALPYAVLFGVTEHWLKFYETLDLEYPIWYHGTYGGLNTLSDSMNSAITPPPSSSGGMSGGGGFSGGGGGGGGGGSW